MQDVQTLHELLSLRPRSIAVNSLSHPERRGRDTGLPGNSESATQASFKFVSKLQVPVKTTLRPRSNPLIKIRI